jgi:hypothetical protein
MEHRTHGSQLPIAILGIVTVLLTGCGASSGAMPGASPAASAPAPVPTNPVDDPEEAAQRVFAANPLISRVQAFDPDLAGQCCWYDVRTVADGYRVVIEVGWGDCQSGCIERHRWTYAVAQDGTSRLLAEDGASLPPGPLPE